MLRLFGLQTAYFKTDFEIGQDNVNIVLNHIENNRLSDAIKLINNNAYFICICANRRGILDLNMLRGNPWDSYNKINFDREPELKIATGLLKIMQMQNTELSYTDFRSAYAQALIRWFDVCFRSSRNLVVLLECGDGFDTSPYSVQDHLENSMAKYVKNILETNMLARRYIESILAFDQDLIEARNFDSFLQHNKRKTYFFNFMSEANKLFQAGLVLENFKIYKDFRPVWFI